MIYDAAQVRRLSTKFQVNTYKSKRDRSLACAVVHLVIEIQAKIYDAARVRRLCTIFQVNTPKNKHFLFGDSYLGGGGVEGAGHWTVSSQYIKK